MRRTLPALLIVLAACACTTQSNASPPQSTPTAAPATQTLAPLSTPSPIPPTSTPTFSATPMPTPTATPTTTPSPSPTDTPQPTSVPVRAILPAATSQPSVPTAPDAPINIALVIQKVGYDRWGRPKSMDDPHATTCGPFDDTRPMLRLLISIAATNGTGQDWPINSEQVGFVKTGGTPAHWCYYDYMDGGNYPVIHPGETYQITLSAFVEPNERVDAIIFGIQDMGYTSAKIPTDLPTP